MNNSSPISVIQHPSSNMSAAILDGHGGRRGAVGQQRHRGRRFRKTDVDYPGLYAHVCGRLFSTCRPGRQKPVLNSLFFTKKSEVLLLRRAQRPRLVNGESFHKPAVFLTGKGADFRRVARPLKPAGIQPHIQQHKAGLSWCSALSRSGFLPQKR